MRPETEAEAARWRKKAWHDLNAVRRLNTPECLELDVIAFHCQQAVEKCLKALLIHHEVAFGKIHDLGVLLDKCATCCPDLESLRDDVEPLTLFAVAFRYPGPAEIAREQANAAHLVAERVWRELPRILPLRLFPK